MFTTMEKKADFKVYAKNYDIYRKADLGLLETAIDSLKIDTSMRVLDFGCGTGNYLKALQMKGYNNLFGLDQSEEMCKIASEKSTAIIKKGSHVNVPYEDDYFDAIIIIDVVHFITDIKFLFDSLWRICKNNGRVFIATQSQTQLETRVYSKYFPSTTTIDKLRHHDISKLISAAESSGFSLHTVKDYLTGADFLVDDNYFNLIKNKAFYIFRLLSDDEFNDGVAKLQIDMNNGSFIAKYPGRTLITLEKERGK